MAVQVAPRRFQSFSAASCASSKAFRRARSFTALVNARPPEAPGAAASTSRWTPASRRGTRAGTRLRDASLLPRVPPRRPLVAAVISARSPSVRRARPWGHPSSSSSRRSTTPSRMSTSSCKRTLWTPPRRFAPWRTFRLLFLAAGASRRCAPPGTDVNPPDGAAARDARENAAASVAVPVSRVSSPPPPPRPSSPRAAPPRRRPRPDVPGPKRAHPRPSRVPPPLRLPRAARQRLVHRRLGFVDERVDVVVAAEQRRERRRARRERGDPLGCRVRRRLSASAFVGINEPPVASLPSRDPSPPPLNTCTISSAPPTTPRVVRSRSPSYRVRDAPAAVLEVRVEDGLGGR